MCDQVIDTLRQFNDFTFTAEFEIDLVISRRGLIHGLSEIKQGFHHLVRQHKADPNAQEKGESRNYTEHPFRTIKEISGVLVILLNTSPASAFQFGR